MIETTNDMVSRFSELPNGGFHLLNWSCHFFAGFQVCSLRLLGGVGILGNILLTTLLHLLGSTLCYPLFECCFLDIPVIHKIKVEALSDKRFSKHANKLLIIRFFFKFQFSGVIQKMLKLLGIPRAQILNACHSLLNFDLFVFFFFCFSWKPLPWERASDKVHQNNAYLLEIISTSLFYPEMGIQRGISGSTSQRFVVLKGNVSARSWVFVSLGKTKIDDVDYVLLLLDTY